MLPVNGLPNGLFHCPSVGGDSGDGIVAVEWVERTWFDRREGGLGANPEIPRLLERLLKGVYGIGWDLMCCVTVR